MRGGGAGETGGRTTPALPVLYDPDGVTNTAIVGVPCGVLASIPVIHGSIIPLFRAKE